MTGSAQVCFNVEAGIRIESDGKPLIEKDNRVHDGYEDGILVSRGGAGVIRGNRIYQNQKSGIRVRG